MIELHMVGQMSATDRSRLATRLRDDIDQLDKAYMRIYKLLNEHQQAPAAFKWVKRKYQTLSIIKSLIVILESNDEL